MESRDCIISRLW